MAVRTCKVSCRDPQGVEHTVEVSAQSVFEAVAHRTRGAGNETNMQKGR
jgi:hypothetical protein